MSDGNPKFQALTAFPVPHIEDLKTEQAYIEEFRQRCIELSDGQLRDFSDSSPLKIIAEAQAAMFTEFVNTFFSTVFPEIVAQSWELLGLERGRAEIATTTARFQLDGVYPTQVVIPAFYRFEVSDVTFETTAPVIIRDGIDSSVQEYWQQCSTTARAIEPGGQANLPAQKADIISPIEGLSEIWTDESRGGRTEESPVAFRNRVSSILIGAIGDTERPIVNVREYEEEARAILGQGSAAIAVPEVDPAGSHILMAMTLYVLSEGGNEPTQAELSRVESEIARRAQLSKGRLFVEVMPVSTINILLSVSSGRLVNEETLGNELNRSIREAFSLDKTPDMRELDVMKLGQVVYNTTGVDSAYVYWGFDGDPQLRAGNLTPPSINPGEKRPQLAKIGHIEINFTSDYKIDFDK